MFSCLAAHCIIQKHSSRNIKPRDVLAYFGAYNLSDHYESERTILSPIDIILHDKWNPRATQYDADLSLLKFEKGKIHFSLFIQPICLWNSENEPMVKDGVVVGWGRSEDETRAYQSVPRMLKIRIQTNEDCFLENKALVDLSSKRTFCAGLKNGSGVCQGDRWQALLKNAHGVFMVFNPKTFLSRR